MKILIVDDNKENLYFLETLLKGNGYQVISAANGAEALEKLRTDGFDMIISDILMPVMDGFQLCRECKMDDNLQDIPFIFYTATYVDEKDEELALALGADKFIRKPMEPDEFMRIIKGVTKDAEAHKLARKKPADKEEKEVFKLYSERLVNKLEKKMLDLEIEIAGHKQAEEALLESESKYRSLVETGGAGVASIDLEGNLTFINQSLLGQLGYSEEEIVGKNFADFLHPEDGERVLNTFMEGVANPDLKPKLEFRLMTKDGQSMWYYTAPTSVITSGTLSGASAILANITERKQAEEALRQSEEKYRMLFDISADGILIADMETRRLQYANPAMCRMLRYTEEELRTMDVAAIHPKEDLRRVVAEFEAQARGDKTLASDIPCLRKDGTIVYADINTVNITVDGRKCNAGFFRDVTERKQAEQQALVNAKLASVGELVAGVAHEINNPLTGIIGYAQLLADRKDVPQSVKEDLQKIYEESQRTVRIVQNLLHFARQYKPEKSLVDINELVERTLELEAYKIRTSNVELSTELAADIPLMLADYNQLQQVILNIITNAQQAIAETRRKGKIAVTTEVVEDYVRVSVADNGPGISVEDMAKIFDPFFTTKPEGSGSGLGLSVCHGIITEHGGNIYAESTRGRGTTFIIELPIASGEQSVIKEEKAAKKKSRRPRRKMADNILIVEDEPAIRDVLTRTLSARGYQVQAVSDGKAGLGKLAKNAYDLIFTDLKMPGMSGIELYEAIKKKYPTLAKSVVFITGDVMTGNTAKFLNSTGRPYLIKPFDSKDLIDIIEKSLVE
jgi:PAS domain S-box-containing protein